MSTCGRFGLRVWGPYACFTRPEMKVERVSYALMTPSAARGILEAIFWKPEFQWRIREIWVLNPIRHFSIQRNEVNSRATAKVATTWQRNGGGYFAEEDRARRYTLGLRDVSYALWADMELAEHANDPIMKYVEQFERRLKAGRCFHRPYLGCREFAAFFGPLAGDEEPIDFNDDLGLMLFDLDYSSDAGRHTPKFFHATLDNGMLRVPAELYQKGAPHVLASPR